MKRLTVIEPYDPNWSLLYAAEERLLRSLLGQELTAIHHIGSTSVPAIGFAKPIIDILAEVKDITFIDLYDEELSLNGYTARGENGIAGRRYFTKGGADRSHHLHIFQTGDMHARNHLLFKQYLTAHPEEADAYGKLKLELAEKYPDDVKQYQEAKESFTAKILDRAIAWGGNRIDH
ncbi:GrpB family protein [Marinicrinis lubricantis]|uniref:GrpB family protein n=1 Tax=Marinicrinis lubricantis TaxID=2086470 RepID=A0ABW1ILX5_9BACL